MFGSWRECGEKAATARRADQGRDFPLDAIIKAANVNGRPTIDNGAKLGRWTNHVLNYRLVLRNQG